MVKHNREAVSCASGTCRILRSSMLLQAETTFQCASSLGLSITCVTASGAGPRQMAVRTEGGAFGRKAGFRRRPLTAMCHAEEGPSVL